MPRKVKGGKESLSPAAAPEDGPQYPRMICRPIWLPMAWAALLAMAPKGRRRRTGERPLPPPGGKFAPAFHSFALGPGRELFVGGFPIDGFFVMAIEHGFLDDLCPFLRGKRGQAAVGGIDKGPFHDGGRSLFRPAPETRASPTASSVIALAVSSLGLARKVSAAVLTVFWSLGVKARRACWTRFPSCPRTVSGRSSGILGHEVYAHPFRADQAHHLLDLFLQDLGHILEEEMGFVKKEDQPGFGRVARPPGDAQRARRASRAGRWRKASGTASACRPPEY